MFEDAQIGDFSNADLLRRAAQRGMDIAGPGNLRGYSFAPIGDSQATGNRQQAIGENQQQPQLQTSQPGAGGRNGLDGQNGPKPTADIAGPEMHDRNMFTLPASAVTAGSPRIAGDMAEMGRLRSTGSGISQIHNPFLRGLARTADIAGTTLMPSVALQIPGTEAHHNLLMRQATNRLNTDLGAEHQEAVTAEQQSKAEQERVKAEQMQKMIPITIHGEDGDQTLYIPQDQIGRVTGAQITARSRENVADKNAASKKDVEAMKEAITSGKVAKVLPVEENGKTVMVGFNAQGQRVTQFEGALPPSGYLPKSTDTTQYMQDAEGNVVALPKHTTTGPVVAGAQPGAAVPHEHGSAGSGAGGHAVQAHSVAGPGGEPLKGKAPEHKPTADEQRRADLAKNLKENLQVLEEIAKRRPDLFGPVAGRMTSLKESLGSSDPDIGTLATVRHQIGMAQISAHGMRSAHGIEGAAESILNSFHNSAPAVLASIKAVRDSVQTFLDDAARAEQRGGGGTVTYHDGDKHWDIPVDREQEFKKKHPQAVRRG